MMNTFFLVNVVHNDFKDTDLIFKGFHEAVAGLPSPAAAKGGSVSLQNGMKVINDVAHGLGQQAQSVTVA